MESSSEPDHRLHVTITAGRIRIEDVLCDLYLPKRLTDPIRLYFNLTSEQGTLMPRVFQFSIEGTQRNVVSGQPSLTVQADTVHSIQLSTKHWGFDTAETVLIAEPIDLRVTDLFDQREPSAERSVTGSFWLTPSLLLSPDKSIQLSDTGDVLVRTVRQLQFALPDGLELAFDKEFRYETPARGETLTYTQLVAKFESESGPTQKPSSTLSALDDILMLTSLAESRRCVCLGWDIWGAGSRTRYFRRDITIPKPSQDHDLNLVLIDLAEFEGFLTQAYATLVNSSHQDMLRQAIYRAVPREGQTVESQFLTLYSALETMVSIFSKERQSEYVLDDANWTRLRSELQGWLKEQPQLESKEKRQLIYQKLNELNRISFGTAFSRFCDSYGIDLKDLWPVTAYAEGPSLSAIRNNLIHGEHFKRSQLDALAVARDHLQWVVERSVLAVLGWSCDRSKISPGFLQNFTSYKGWEKYPTTLSVPASSLPEHDSADP